MKTKPVNKQISLSDLLKRPEIEVRDLKVFGKDIPFCEDWEVSEPVEIRIKYRGHIDRQNEFIHQSRKFEKMKIPPTLDYSKVFGLSNEEMEKLSKIKPSTIAQAQRISGVNPSGIQAILMHTARKSSNFNSL